jgi:REP element-mobilizing transposase RayT
LSLLIYLLYGAGRGLYLTIVPCQRNEMFKTALDKATVKRELKKMVDETIEEYRIKFLRKKIGWRRHRKVKETL